MENNKEYNPVKLIHWAPSAMWSWKLVSNECSICKNKLTEKCGECMNDLDLLKKRCNPCKLKCGHGFHHHCVIKMMGNGINECPIDKTYASIEFEDMEMINKTKKMKK